MDVTPESGTCAEARRLLHPYLDEELGRAARARVERHLAACRACAAGFAVERALLARIAAVGDERAPARLKARVAAILAGDAGEDAPGAGWSRRGWWVAAAPLAAAAAIAAVLLLRPAGNDIAAAEAFVADHAAHAADRPSAHPFPAEVSLPPAPPRIPGTRIAGLSLCVIGGRAYAHWVVVLERGPVSVFVPVEPGDDPALEGERRVAGATVVAIHDLEGRLGALLVSREVPAASMSILAGW